MTCGNSNIPPRTVTRRPRLTSLSQRASFSRALSLLLLVFILYGTTIEAAHRHGRILDLSSGKTTSVSQTQGSPEAGNTALGCGECLICQLHQNFSTSLIAVRPGSSPLRTRLELLRLAAVALKSQTSTPQKGRAPPLA
jgi:hypothetical protein